LSLTVLNGRAHDVLENQEFAIAGENENRAMNLAKACADYANKHDGTLPLSVRVLLESGIVDPNAVAQNNVQAAVLQRASSGDKTVSDSDIESATGFKYLGSTSAIRPKDPKDSFGSTVILYGLGKPHQGKVLVGWSGGWAEYIEPSSLDKPLGISAPSVSR
jgi:hypothetical protein